MQVASVTTFLTTRPRKKEIWPVVFYLIYSIASLFILNYIIQKISHKEFLSYRIITIVEGLCFMGYLYLIISSNLAKKLLLAAAFIFFAYSIYDMTKSKAEYFDSIPTVIECLILIAFSVFYFYEQLKRPDTLFLYNTSNFWLVVGIIIFFSASFFAFIYAQNNSTSPEFKQTFRLINAISGFIENILFLIAFIIARKQSKSIKPNIVAKTT